MAKDTKKAKGSERGEVRIADDVIAVIAGLAATEVEGVDSMAGNITKELINKLGGNKLANGVRVEVKPDGISAQLSLNIKYGYNIMQVSEKVQERVKTAIENMTGFTVNHVVINVAGISMAAE